MAAVVNKRRVITIDLEIESLMDQRFETLGNIAGYNRYEAHGRMFALWAWVLEKQPEGYVVTEGVVRSFLGANGVDAILASGCNELALGERRDGGIYVRGSHRFEWLKQRRAAAKLGGLARKNAGRNTDGTFINPGTQTDNNDDVQPADSQPTSSQTVPSHQPNRSENPADSQPSASASALIREEICGDPLGPAGGVGVLRLVSPRPTRARKPPNPDHTPAKAAWFAYWARKTNGTEPTWGGSQAKALSEMLSQHKLAGFLRRIELLEASTDPYHRRWDFNAFARSSDQLLASSPGRPGGHAPAGERPRQIPVAKPRISEDT